MSVIVTLPYDPTWQALDWVKKHCPSYITNDVHKNEYHSFDNPNYKIDYFFGNETDALIFKLKWS